MQYTTAEHYNQGNDVYGVLLKMHTRWNQRWWLQCCRPLRDGDSHI